MSYIPVLKDGALRRWLVKRRYFERRTILPLKSNNKIVPLLLTEKGLSIGTIDRQENYCLIGYFVYPKHNHSNEVTLFKLLAE